MALRSMTGFGRGEAQANGFKVSVQLKTVNNRFVEGGVKLPSALWAFEAEARALLAKAVTRGKVDAQFHEERLDQAGPEVKADLNLGHGYRKALEDLAQGLGLNSDVRLEQIARFPGVISGAEETSSDPEAAAKRFEAHRQALQAALAQLTASREREGAALESELRRLLALGLEKVARIEARANELAPLFIDKVKKRMQAVLEKLPDEGRLIQEAALQADKADIREEIVRFRAHVDEFTRLLNEGGVAGKRLDFLSQELLREANTMGSKSPDASLSHEVVALKTEVEKIKEQIQNIE